MARKTTKSVETKSIEVQVSPETVECIQRLSYEVEGLKVLHTHALGAGLAADQVEGIKKEFLERFAECQIAKQEMWEKYGGGRPDADWNLNFDTGILTIKESAHAK